MHRALNILFVARPDLEKKLGGDTVQLHCTKRELEKFGHHIHVLQPSHDNDREFDRRLSSYDLIHFFNLSLSHQYSGILRAALVQSIPRVLSPIFWDMREYDAKGRSIGMYKQIVLRAAALFPISPVKKKLSSRLKSMAFNPFYVRVLGDTLSRCSLLLPNSAAEQKCIESTFQTSIPSTVVLNGARTLDTPHAELPFELPSKFILNVGRIEYRKNQLNLIRACVGLDLPIVCVGEINRTEISYWIACQNEARRFKVWLLHIPNQPFSIIRALYSRALLHIQPSWFETPGLASLEAAAAGCPVICTEVGSAKEYFGSYALYCHPDNPRSIRSAIDQMLRRSVDRSSMMNFISRTYTWQKAGQKTNDAYLSLVQQ